MRPVFNATASLSQKGGSPGRWLLSDCFKVSGHDGIREGCSTDSTGALPMPGEVDLLEPADPKHPADSGAVWTPAAFGGVPPSGGSREKLRDVLALFQWDPQLEYTKPRATDITDGVDTVIFSLQHWAIGNHSGPFPIKVQAEIVVRMMATYAHRDNFPKLRKLIWLAHPQCYIDDWRRSDWRRGKLAVAGLRELFVSVWLQLPLAFCIKICISISFVAPPCRKHPSTLTFSSSSSILVLMAKSVRYQG
jgi:hypothetical protein